MKQQSNIDAMRKAVFEIECLNEEMLNSNRDDGCDFCGVSLNVIQMAYFDMKAQIALLEAHIDEMERVHAKN